MKPIFLLMLFSLSILSACATRINDHYSGFVVDESGEPVSGVVVFRYYGEADYDVNEEDYTLTDGRGYFRIPRGEYGLPDLVFFKHSYETDTLPIVWAMHGEKEVYSPVVTSDSAKVVMRRRTAEPVPIREGQLLADGNVEFLNYTAYQSDRTTWIKRMDVVRKDADAGYVIRIERSDDIEYWYFRLKNAPTNNNVLIAEIDSIVTHNTYGNAWTDDQAPGTVVSNRNTGVETLDFYFNQFGDKDRFVLRWKASPDHEDDPIHAYMRSRHALTWEEVHLPLKQWGNEQAEALMDELCGHPVGAWCLEGENDSGKYAYNIHFSPTGEVSFRYFIEEEFQNGKRLSDLALERRGIFDIDGDVVEIRFTKLLGSRYGRSNAWDDPLEETLTVRLKIKPEVRDYEDRRLAITQISGGDIFENNTGGEALWFTASILPPLLR